MGTKKITDLQLVDEFSDDLDFPVDDGIQTYRASGAQLKAFIEAYLLPRIFSTGDVKPTLKTSADTGWVMANDGTIGKGSSGATTRANDDTELLFTLVYNNISNTYAAVSGGRTTDAATDFAAGKTIALPKMLGRALASAGAGSGLTSRALGLILGEETHVLISSEMPVHTHTQNAHNHVTQLYYNDTGPGSAATAFRGSGNGVTGGTEPTGNATAVNQNAGGDGAHNNMQPTAFVNFMIKL